MNVCVSYILIIARVGIKSWQLNGFALLHGYTNEKGGTRGTHLLAPPLCVDPLPCLCVYRVNHHREQTLTNEQSREKERARAFKDRVDYPSSVGRTRTYTAATAITSQYSCHRRRCSNE
jgi:hypothetical protein